MGCAADDGRSLKAANQAATTGSSGELQKIKLKGSERGPEAPFDTICLNLNRPLAIHKGDAWENQIRRKRNRQNLFVIQMIGPPRLRVKRKTGTYRIAYNILSQNSLQPGFILEILWKNLWIPVRGLGFWFLRWRNPGSYLPSRWSVINDPSAAE